MFKSRLSVYCQKNNLPFPVYIDERDSNLLWTSTISLPHIVCTGEAKKSKKEAQDNTAHKVLSQIEEDAESVGTSGFKNSCLLIDVENLHTFADLVSGKVTGLDIYAFVGRFHPLNNKTFGDDISRVIVNTAHKDGCDVCIELYTGIFLSQEKYETYYIATRDNFAHPLVELIRDPNNIWKPANAIVVTTPQELFSYSKY